MSEMNDVQPRKDEGNAKCHQSIDKADRETNNDEIKQQFHVLHYG